MTTTTALMLGALLGCLLGLTAGALLARALAPRSSVPEVGEQLARVEGLVREAELEQARALGELREQLARVGTTSEQLGRETAALKDALRRPQSRGRWGEVQLRTVLEHAGMLDRCDFVEQPTVLAGDGAVQRPDLVVRLGGGRSLVVDAKVPLAAYLEALEAADATTREERMQAHARHLRQHVERLAAKDYWQRLPQSPEFVVLFVPGEALLAPALERDPALLEDAYRLRVHVATPTTLLSLLRGVAHAWQQQALADGAREVVAAGRELLQRMAALGGHVDKLGRSLGTAVNDFNKAVGSLERSVLPSARRVAAVALDDAPPAPAPVDALPRPLSAPELLAGDAA